MSQPTLECLPVKLQLAILGSITSRNDFTSLTFASPSYEATYLKHKKLTISQATRAALGDMFVDACMLYHWKHNINSYTNVEDDGISSHQPTETKTEGDPAVDTQPWPPGPYRHIQIKFLYDYDKLAMAGREDQVKCMQALLTAEDFSRILSFHYQVVQPLSILSAFSIPIMRYDAVNRHRWDCIFEGDCQAVRKGQCRWIMRALYRVQILYRLYGTTRTAEKEGIVDLGESHNEAITSDFLSRYDARDGARMELQIVHTVVLSYLHKYFDVIGQRLEHLMAMDPMITPIFEVAAELMRSGPLDLSKFVWETVMGTKEVHHFSIEWRTESWTGHFPTRYELEDRMLLTGCRN